MESLIQLINWKYVIIYFLVMNIVGFLAMGIDKYKAKKGYWRIPEATLLTICAIGGGIGTIARYVYF